MKEMTPFNSLDVASYIANRCHAKGIHYNNTKIQKLLYCCYGSLLAVKGVRLCDEHPRAWQYGPVFPRVFNYIKKGKDLRGRNLNLNAPSDVLTLIDDVLDAFGRYTATTLSNWTHQKDSPWDRALNELEGEPNGFIPDDLIGEYFKNHVVRES